MPAALCRVPELCSDCGAESCETSLAGDCNLSALLESNDERCIGRCLVGLYPAASDCFCAADCNCEAGLEASDPVCLRLRLAGMFVDDPCLGAQPDLDSETALQAGLRLRIGKARALGRREGFRIPVSLRGRDASEVASLQFDLGSQSEILHLRMARRLRQAGFRTQASQRSIRERSLLILPPQTLSEPGTIGRGRVARLSLGGPGSAVAVCGVSFGSSAGRPLEPSDP